jgi:hypothetical protein
MPSNPMANNTNELGSGVGLAVKVPYRPGGAFASGPAFGSSTSLPASDWPLTILKSPAKLSTFRSYHGRPKKTLAPSIESV